MSGVLADEAPAEATRALDSEAASLKFGPHSIPAILGVLGTAESDGGDHHEEERIDGVVEPQESEVVGLLDGKKTSRTSLATIVLLETVVPDVDDPSSSNPAQAIEHPFVITPTTSQPAATTTSRSNQADDAPLLIPVHEQTLPPLPESTHHPDSPTITLIATLRDQITLLTDQGLALNTKLLTSLDRLSTLEDTLELTRQTSTAQIEEIAVLRKEKNQWEESMSTGLLVERGTIKEEMQKLVEGLVEEERKRGSAELGRKQVEQEVDDLSATLFEQANNMVAEQRLARIRAESRLKEAQDNLSAAETAMRDMQTHLQSLPTLLPAHDLSHGSPAQSPDLTRTGISASSNAISSRRYLANHVPHTDFLTFIGHIRSSKPQHAYNLLTLAPPAITSLSAQPFIARTMIEDHDPTLRMDTAPDLSWLTRRSVTQAIITGELIIEPVGLNALLASPAYMGHTGDIGCSMCGRSVFPPPSPASAESGKHQPSSPRDLPPPPAHLSARSGANSTSRFSLKPFFTSPSPGPPSSSQPASPVVGASSTPYTPSPPVFIFRIAVNSSSNASDKDKEKEGRYYPLCATGWCLARLRTTCELWRYIRLGLVETVWKGEDGTGWVAGTKRYSLSAGPDSKRASVSGSRPTTPVPAAALHIDISSELGEIREESVSPGPAKKRPAWGLGFRSNSGGGTGGDSKQQRSSGGGWFGKGPTPPHSPLTERPSSIHKVDLDSEDLGDGHDEVERKVDAVDAAGSNGSDEKAALESAITFELEERSEAFEKRLSEAAHDASAEGSTVAIAGADLETKETAAVSAPGSSLQPPARKPATTNGGSRSSMDSTAETHDFKTPLGSETSQPATPDPSQPTDTAPTSLASSQPTLPLRVTSDSPRTSLDLPNRPPRRSPAPPPLPERAAARSSLELAAPVDLVEPPRTPDPGAAQNPVTPDPSSTPHPPHLPPRKARASMTTAGTGLNAGQRFLEGDNWELKAWKEIIRLKEEMVRARVGVFPRE